MNDAVTAVINGTRTIEDYAGQDLRRDGSSVRQLTSSSHSESGSSRGVMPRLGPGPGHHGFCSRNGELRVRTRGCLMIDLTTMDREPETADEAQYERGMTLGLRLVVCWHVAGAAAAVVMMLLASRSGDEELPATIGVFLRLFAIASFVAHAAAAFGVAQRRRWGRTLVAGRELPDLRRRRRRGDPPTRWFHRGRQARRRASTRRSSRSSSIAVGLVWVLVAGADRSGQADGARPQAPPPGRMGHRRARFRLVRDRRPTRAA